MKRVPRAEALDRLSGEAVEEERRIPAPGERLEYLIVGEIDRTAKEAMIHLTCVKPGPDGKPCGNKFTRRVNRLFGTRHMCEPCTIAERAKPRCRKCGKLDHATVNCPDSAPKNCPKCHGMAHRVEGESCSKCGLVYEAEEISVFEKPRAPVKYVKPTVLDTILISKIRRDRSTQSRVGVDEEVVAEYTEHLKAGDKFPPVVVFYDGTSYWLADGYHRVECNLRAGYNAVECDIRSGGQRDAILYAVGANAKHGRQRTAEDKRRAVTMLLEDRSWCASSDNWIAHACVVSNHFVAKVRRELAEAKLREEVAKRPVGAGVHLGSIQGGAESVNPTRRGRDKKVYEFPNKRVVFSAERSVARVVSLVDSLLEQWPAGTPTEKLAAALRDLAKRVEARTVVREVEQA